MKMDVSVVACLVVLALVGSLQAEEKTISGRQAEPLVELKGSYIVNAEYIIPKGFELRVCEGTTIVFLDNVGLSVSSDAKLTVSGTSGKPVIFKGKSSGIGAWTGIRMENSAKVDICGAVVMGAKIGLRSAWGSTAVIRKSVFTCNEKGVCFWENNGQMEDCVLTKNKDLGAQVHYGPSTFDHCTISENGRGIGGWGSARLIACRLSENNGNGIDCGNGKSTATECLIENNRGFDVVCPGGVWDFGKNYWGVVATRMLMQKGPSANLPKVKDKLDGHREGIVDLTGFLTKPPSDCGARDYPGCKKSKLNKDEPKNTNEPKKSEQDAPDEPAAAWATNLTAAQQASANAVVKVWPVKREKPKYIAIDLSGGTAATHYPIEYLDEIPGGSWSDEYKTSKLVLRHIPAGSFIMGGRATDYPGAVNTNLHMVTLTKDFYMGVFEVTQRQWELVMGNRPSAFSNETCYATRPVEQVSYIDIRGGVKGITWPESKEVDDGSFIGVLRKKSGLTAFDLPTEAQWEYACRAGTTTALNSGKNILELASVDENLSEVGRYSVTGSGVGDYSCDVSNGSDKVGMHKANDLGLYDMHGNVWERVLDRTGYRTVGVDPVGNLSSVGNVVCKGGGWNTKAFRCTSANYSDDSISWVFYNCGLRLCLQGGELPEQDGGTVLVNAAGEGTANWTPTKAGTYYLTHETQTNGVAALQEPLFVKPMSVPDAVQIEKAAKIARELCEDDTKALKAGSLKGEKFALKLIGYSGQTENAAVKFVLLRNALRQFLMAGDIKNAQALFDRAFDKFGGRFAAEMANYSSSTLRKLANSPKLSKSVKQLLTLVEESMASCKAIAEAEADLKKRSSDMQAKLKLALHAVELQDWELALKTYAEIDGKRRDVCRWEIKALGADEKGFTCEQVGDFWWESVDGKNEQGLLFRSVSRHAAYWYRKALAEEKMTELKSALVKKRIAKARGL